MSERSLKPEDIAVVASGSVTARVIYGNRAQFSGVRPYHGLAYAHKAGLVMVEPVPCRIINGIPWYPVSLTSAGVAWMRRESRAAVASLFRPAYVCHVRAARYSMEVA